MGFADRREHLGLVCRWRRALAVAGGLGFCGLALADSYSDLSLALERAGSTGGPGRQYELTVDYCGERGMNVTSRCVYYKSHGMPTEDQAAKYKFSWADVRSVRTGFAPCGNPTVVVNFRHPIRYWSTVSYPDNWAEGKIDEASLILLSRPDAAKCRAQFRSILAFARRNAVRGVAGRR